MRISPNIDKPEINEHLFPVREKKLPPSSHTSKNLAFEAYSGESISCRFYPAKTDAPVIIIYPSTFSSIENLNSFASGFLEHNINVLLTFCGNIFTRGNLPSIASFFSDGHAVFEKSINWLESAGYSGPRILMGQALGTALALDIAACKSEKMKGLFLEGSICETIPYLKALGVPVEKLGLHESDGFDIIETIENIKLPTLIFHGSNDPITPVPHAEKLQVHSGARTKQFFVIPGGTSDALYLAGGELYFQTIRKFLDTICGTNTWRQRRKKFRNEDKS